MSAERAARRRGAGLALLVGVVAWLWATQGSDEAARTEDPARSIAAPSPAPRLVGADGSTAPVHVIDEGAPAGVLSSGPDPARPIAKGRGSVAGTIAFDDGTPMANARVSLTISPAKDGRDTVVTDAAGRFRFHDEWVGPRSVTLVRDDGTVLLLREIVLEPDRVVAADVTVARGVVVSGRVSDARGQEPMQGTRVTLRRPLEARTQAVYAHATTSSDGRFRFEHVPPAHVTVEFVRPGREPRLEILDVGARDVVLHVTLSPSRPLVVRYEPVPKEAVGERMGWLLSGPTDRPERFLHGSGASEGTVTLSEAGEVRLDAPPPGRYRLVLQATRTLPRLETDFEVTASEAPVIRVPLTAAGRVTGTLLDAGGAPLVGLAVGLGELVSDPTDGEGRFSFARVPVGSLEASVRVSGIRVRLPAVEVSPVGETVLSLKMPGTSALTLTLSTPAPYGGSLDVRAATGESVASGGVRTGRRVSLSGLSSGSHVVWLSSSDHVRFRREVTLEPGKTLDLGEVALVAMPVVPVRVTLPPGTPRPRHVTVHVRERTPPWEHGIAMAGRIDWDADGRAWLKGLPAARYRVAVQWTPSADVADLPVFDIDVRDGVVAPVDLDLSR
jgi:hypothetical protein